MADHTQGPWTVFEDEIVAEQTDQHLCTVPLEDGINPTEWQANLRLIAAAPELLDALQEMTRRFEACLIRFGTEPEYAALAVASARSVIAKAEGR